MSVINGPDLVSHLPDSGVRPEVPAPLEPTHLPEAAFGYGGIPDHSLEVLASLITGVSPICSPCSINSVVNLLKPITYIQWWR